MAFENTAGLGVNNQYGPRNTGGAAGLEQGTNSVARLSISITGEMLNSGFVTPQSIPKYASFKSAHITVHEAFVVTGTTPTILVGAAGSVATNGFIISETELETLGSRKLANDGEGTWDVAHATGTTAAALVDFAFEGDAAVTNAGRATLVLEYVNLYKP
jgi:hypothetical protein